MICCCERGRGILLGWIFLVDRKLASCGPVGLFIIGPEINRRQWIVGRWYSKLQCWSTWYLFSGWADHQRWLVYPRKNCIWITQMFVEDLVSMVVADSRASFNCFWKQSLGWQLLQTGWSCRRRCSSFSACVLWGFVWWYSAVVHNRLLIGLKLCCRCLGLESMDSTDFFFFFFFFFFFYFIFCQILYWWLRVVMACYQKLTCPNCVGVLRLTLWESADQHGNVIRIFDLST